MAKAKPISPYTRLLNEARLFIYKALNPIRVPMFFYPKGKLNNGWKLENLYIKTKTAEELGYKVELKATDKGLEVEYVKQPPSIPLNFRY